jgi:hypothetical protein
MSAAANHLSADDLLAWWLREDGADDDAVEQHLMACDACGEELDALVALGHGVREAFRAGAVGTMATQALVDRLTRDGLRLREYRVPHDGSIACTVTPDDDLLVSHVQAPLQGVERIDAIMEVSVQPGVQHRMDDVPFDPSSGEVIYVPNVQAVRQLPDHVMQLTLLAVSPDGERELGRYTFHHAAHRG